MESTNKNKFTFNGKVASAIISASIGLIAMGIMTYTRNSLVEILELWKPIAAVGGIWLYGYLAWIISWMVLYKLIGKRQKVGNAKIWLIVFFISLAIATVLIEVSLTWPPLS